MLTFENNRGRFNHLIFYRYRRRFHHCAAEVSTQHFGATVVGERLVKGGYHVVVQRLRRTFTPVQLYPFEMSGGMLQRMMIAMAVLCESPFIIADEPTTDLDVVAQARILDLLESIMQKQAPGMLLVTHDMGVVARLADDVAVMSHGKIVEQGDVETLFNAPKHAVTRSLVSAHLALYGMELAS